jgi:hypothetical protein
MFKVIPRKIKNVSKVAAMMLGATESWRKGLTNAQVKVFATTRPPRQITFMYGRRRLG